MNPSSTKLRRVGIWLDLDWGLKRELEVYAGFQKYADQVGWRCKLDPILERSLASKSGTPRYDGVVARVTPEMERLAGKAGVPLVNIWLNSPVSDTPSVLADYESSGAMVAEHLLGRGFRQFGYFGYQKLEDSRLQLDGFQKALRQRGLECSTHRVRHKLSLANSPDWERFVKQLSDWVDSWALPIGIFVCEDLLCRFLIDLCREKGLAIPTDVAIVGCENEAVMCESPAPSLTSVDMGHAQRGYRAARLLEKLMNGGDPPKRPVLVPPAELVVRQSTDSYAVNDQLVAKALLFMAENSHEVLKVKDVVVATMTTRRTLERRFRAILGKSVAEEMVRLRLSRAKRRLVETDAALKTVALDSGFLTANHFSKVFSRVEGMTPTQYRQERQNLFMQRG
jgi:LacI family transcriptional regulator